MADGGPVQVHVITRVPVRDAAPDYATACLTRWGGWLRAGGTLGQGYAHESPEGRLRRQGTMIRGQGCRGRMDDDPLAERVDRIVAALGEDDRRWPVMLRAYFGGAEATHQQVADLLTDRYGEPVSARAVRDWLRLATATVRGALREGVRA